MRRAVPFAILAGCLGVGVLPALAADQDVAIHDSSFTPARVAVKPGESVTWRGSGTTFAHNVHFDGEVAPLGAASHDFTATRRFDAEGVYRYHCDVHPALMRGTVYVNTAGAVPTPTATATPTPTPTPGSTATAEPSQPAGGGAPAGGAPVATTEPGATPGVTAFRVRVARIRQRRVFLLVDLTAPDAVRLRGTLRRSARRIRSVSMRVAPGHRRVRLPGARLKPGRYALTLRAGEVTRHVRFRVRAA